MSNNFQYKTDVRAQVERKNAFEFLVTGLKAIVFGSAPLVMTDFTVSIPYDEIDYSKVPVEKHR